MSKISIVVPVYGGMKNGEFFYQRLIKSLDSQTYKDWELVVTNEGAMAHNTNEGIKRSKGQLIKILYQDDYFAHNNALQRIVDAFEGSDKQWLVSGCEHDPGTHTHLPTWSDKLIEGVNTIGSPSVLTIKSGLDTYFDENLGWLLDCDLYHRLNQKFGQPIYLDDVSVAIGVGEHQTTHRMADKEKLKEHYYLKEKYAT